MCGGNPVVVVFRVAWGVEVGKLPHVPACRVAEEQLGLEGVVGFEVVDVGWDGAGGDIGSLSATTGAV